MTLPWHAEIVSDDDRVIFLMDEISRGARRMFDAQVNLTGLNRTQWRVLTELIKEPASTQTEIAERLDLESATIGLAAAALEKLGYLTRRRAESDRRSRQLELTDKVDAILPQMRGAADHTHEVVWQGIDARRKVELFELLSHIAQNLRCGEPGG